MRPLTVTRMREPSRHLTDKPILNRNGQHHHAAPIPPHSRPRACGDVTCRLRLLRAAGRRSKRCGACTARRDHQAHARTCHCMGRGESPCSNPTKRAGSPGGSVHLRPSVPRARGAPACGDGSLDRAGVVAESCAQVRAMMSSSWRMRALYSASSAEHAVPPDASARQTQKNTTSAARIVLVQRLRIFARTCVDGTMLCAAGLTRRARRRACLRRGCWRGRRAGCKHNTVRARARVRVWSHGSRHRYVAGTTPAALGYV